MRSARKQSDHQLSGVNFMTSLCSVLCSLISNAIPNHSSCAASLKAFLLFVSWSTVLNTRQHTCLSVAFDSHFPDPHSPRSHCFSIQHTCSRHCFSPLSFHLSLFTSLCSPLSFHFSLLTSLPSLALIALTLRVGEGGAEEDEGGEGVEGEAKENDDEDDSDALLVGVGTASWSTVRVRGLAD